MNAATRSSPLKIVIVGAGGIGCYYGMRLQNQGHQVTLVARGNHLKQLQKQGLILEHPDFDYQGDVNACSLNSLIKNKKPTNFDALIICVKATATLSIAKTLKIWFQQTQQKTVVISLQNGIDNETQLAEALGEDCIVGGLAVRIGGHIVSAGHVKVTGIAQIIWGAWASVNSPLGKKNNNVLEQWTLQFIEAGIPTQLVTDIKRELWRKLVINNGVNPLSALTGLDTKALSHHLHFGPMVLGLMQEAARVAKADNVELDEQDAQEMYDLIRHFDPIKTSMLVDHEKGRPLEIEEISGAVIARSKRLNISVPYTESVYALLKHELNN